MSTKSAQINLRINAEVMADLENLAEQEQASRVDMARKILLEGITRHKHELALRLYREGKVSKSRAAEMAGISLWELMELLEQAQAANPYTVEQAVADVRRIVQDSARR